MPGKAILIAAREVKRAARDLPSGEAFSAIAEREEAKEIQGHLLDALIEIAMRLKQAGLPSQSSDRILSALSKAVSDLDTNS